MARAFLIWLSMLALLAAGASPLLAAPPEPGILRVATALPRTLPLHVRGFEGLDMLVRVIDARTGTEVLLAYGRGDALFRVLLPPGRFEVHLAVGRDWQDEAHLFGPATRMTAIGPLDFAINGRARRDGHLITILPDGVATLAVVQAPLAVCQGWQAQIDRAQPVDRPLDGWPDLPEPRRLYSFACG